VAYVRPTLTVDTSRWPMVVLTYSGQPSDEQLAEHLREIEERVLSRHERFVQVIDQSRGQQPDPIQRAMIADHQRKMDAAYRDYCLGEVYIAPPAMRGAMVAVFWQAKPPYPYAFVEAVDEAVRWAESRMKAGTERGRS